MGDLARTVLNPMTLLASAARSDLTGAGDVLDVRGGSSASHTFTLDLTAAASLAGDKLDVFVETRIDGVNWVDIVHFTQALGDGGAKRYIVKHQVAAQAEFEASASLGAASIRKLVGDRLRVRWVITDGTGDKTFTFSVVATPQ